MKQNKQRYNFTLSETAYKTLKDYAASAGLSMSSALELAIRRLFWKSDRKEDEKQ